ncbi:hypothetical protein [Porphyrobacter sp. GA68]|uniref:hypothetical protein n=1 Tax=Porphyrobacter sp. GA68 TaxID=2883480 RepID=UPI001D1925CC|nr:hypothetical protein [Porphyrobacter sp. GA68]
MTTGQPTREERLAAKLRENLRRRKAQARGQATSRTDPATLDAQQGLSKEQDAR